MKIPVTLLACTGLALAEEPIAIAHPEQALEANRTVVWTPTFQAGWDAMNALLGGAPKESGSPLGKQLDHFDWKPESVMPDGRWKVWSGELTREFFLKANQEAAAFLREDEGPFREVEGARPGAVGFYSLLDAEVSYRTPFFRSRKQGLDFADGAGKSSPVTFWGVTGSDSGDYRSDVRVLSWRPKSGFFALELLCKEPAHGSVILYRPPETQTFSTACRWIRTWRKHWPMLSGGDFGLHSDRSLHDQDKLRVPYLKLSTNSNFEGLLQGDRFYGRPGDPYRVFAARQRVDFTLHESGAEVRAVAEGGMDPFAGPPPTVPRDFSFDQPFFVFLWREEAEWPYFGAWIGDHSGMLPFEP